MTLELILSILGAAIVFALVRFVMKKPWAVSILAGLMVLLAVNIHWIKPALESVGTADSHMIESLSTPRTEMCLGTFSPIRSQASSALTASSS